MSARALPPPNLLEYIRHLGRSDLEQMCVDQRAELDRLRVGGVVERAVLDAAAAVAEADLDEDMSACPYFQRGAPGADPEGTCSYGCYDEPQCQTCVPRDGWPLENLRVAVRAWRGAAPTAEETQP